MSDKNYTNFMLENFLFWRKWNLGAAIFLAIVATCTVRISKATAQVAPDNSLGAENSVVMPNVEINETISDRVDGGAVRGANLFHSFQELNVGEGRGVYFNNPSGVENILSRVTGSNPSSILGKLGVLGNASLFLINPNGIIFGSNAILDVRGSFIGTTASSVKFADATQFSTNPAQSTSLLTVSVPIGLQFGSQPGAISVLGNGQDLNFSDILNSNIGLRVQPNRTLALLGGDVSIEGGQLTAEGGRIELGSVAGLSSVSLISADTGLMLEYEKVRNFQDISLSRQAAVTAVGDEGSGIQIRSKVLRIIDGSEVRIPTLGKTAAGNLSVTASDLVEVVGESEDFPASTFLGTLVLPQATGNGGNLNIDTRQLIVKKGAQVFTGTQGQGTAGSLWVKARDSIELSGSAPTLTGRRSGSNIATTSVPGATGSSGNLTLETQRLGVRDGAVVSTTTLGKGTAGNLTIKAGELVELTGTSLGLRSSLSARSIGSAPAGDLSIETKRLNVRDGGLVSTRSSGSGKGGIVQINAKLVNLDNSSGISASAASGEGGNIFLNSRSLQLSNGSSISAEAGGSGNGGNVNIDSSTITLGGSSITANAERGRGGNIEMTAQGLFTTPDSQISASSMLGIDGLVRINIPELDFIKVSQPEQQPQNPQLAIACQGQADVAAGELVDAGTEAAPTDPSNSLNSSSGWHDTNSYPQGSNEIAQLASSHPTPIVEAQGWKQNHNGTVSFTTETDDIIPYGSLSSPACIRTQSR